MGQYLLRDIDPFVENGCCLKMKLIDSFYGLLDSSFQKANAMRLYFHDKACIIFQTGVINYTVE